MYKPCIYTYRHAKMQVFPVEHGLQCRISQSQLACNAKVPVPFQCLLNLQAIHCNSASSRTVSRLQLVCQYLLILLDEATTAVEAKNTKENILVVCQMCNTLDEFNVCMFRALARCIFSPPPHNNFSYFVKYAVSFLEIPSIGSANPIRQMRFQSLQECLAFLVQQGQVTDVNVPLPAQHVPFQGLDQNLSHFIAGVNNRGYLIQRRGLVFGSSSDLGVQFSNLEKIHISGIY